MIEDLRNDLQQGVVLDVPANQLDEWAAEYAEALRVSLLRQFVEDRTTDGDRVLRLSSIGKPAVLQAIKIPTVKEQLINAGRWVEEVPSPKMRDIFHRGDQFEALLLFHLRRAGYRIVSTQETVTFLEVEGHTDAIIEKDGKQLLLEVKTMSDGYFRKFVKEPDDERGYLTQMALYKHCLNDIPSVWVCMNKGTHEIAVVEPNLDALFTAFTRASRIIPKFEKINYFEDVITIFRAPPTQLEVYKGKKTGRELVPTSMKYTPFRNLFYHIYEEKNGYGKLTEYIADYISVMDLPEPLRNPNTSEFLGY